MPLTPAEKQRRYREQRKNNLEKEAECKGNDLERYHASKNLVGDLTTRFNIEHSKRNGETNASPAPSDQDQVIPTACKRLSTPQLSISRENTPNSIKLAATRGRKQVKRDRSKLIRDKMKLQLHVFLKKNKMQKRYLLDDMKNLYLSFKREKPYVEM
ncbi:unnamed protein product [Arctia plantaginis]|uniref:Uncharacterized protein n=1 Tax=Arctia plantaginis TaxID=874455 RepID=A0A8S1A3K0_ARCPL|nr:unnamed protein product [Arctia plantaginis]